MLAHNVKSANFLPLEWNHNPGKTELPLDMYFFLSFIGVWEGIMSHNEHFNGNLFYLSKNLNKTFLRVDGK